MRCCFCNRVITPQEGHDAYPIRPETSYGETEENRCCERCDKSIVRPVRLLFGRDLRSITPQQRTILRNKNYIELLVFGIDCQEILDHGFASIKNQNEYIRKNGVTEELLEKYRRTIKKIEEE